MPIKLEECEQQAMGLPLRERALLIKRLIEGLDKLDERELEELWGQEAARRLQGFRAGRINARAGEEVFASARTRLRDLR